MTTRTWIATVMLGTALAGGSADADVRYVDDDAAPGGDGATWATAYDSLQAALTEARAGGNAVTEVHVARGRYRPDHGPGRKAGDRTASFELVDGVVIRGGYRGPGGGGDPAERDVRQYETVLTGDLDGNDQTNGFIGYEENSWHVLLATDVGPGAVVDGLTITSGHASGSELDKTGGGLLAVRARPTFVDCWFRANLAGFQGGGVQGKEGSDIAFTRCVFSGNRALDNGGGMYNGESSPVLVECTFLANEGVQYAGGVCNRDRSNARFERCQFIGNTAAETTTGGGGGAVVNARSDATFIDCTFSGNTAVFGKGGALVNEPGFEPELGGSFPTIEGCTFADNAAPLGGAMYDLASGPIVRDCTFERNEASIGGAIYHVEGSTGDVADSTFLENVGATGGAIFTMDSAITVASSAFTGNDATVGSGGGGIWNQGGEPTIVGCTFERNRAIRGGGVYNGAEACAVLTDCTFFENEASDDGGGLSNDSSHATVRGCQFIANTSMGGAFVAGGGMSNYFSTLVASRCAFVGNLATIGSFTGGGGLYIEANLDGPSFVTNCLFIDNAGDVGGAIYNFRASPAITNCLMARNRAIADSYAVGGAIYNNFQAFPVVTNCTMVGNDAPDGGGAIQQFGAVLRVVSSIAWDNTPDEINVDPGADAWVEYSIVEGGWSGDGTSNLDADPMFVDAAGDDYRLAPDSPAIDAGHTLALPEDGQDLDDDRDVTELVPLDAGGGPRVTDDPAVPATGCAAGAASVDIGAFEAPGATLAPIRLADLDGSGTVDLADIVALLARWGKCSGTCCPGDVDRDGDVDVADIIAALASWG